MINVAAQMTLHHLCNCFLPPTYPSLHKNITFNASVLLLFQLIQYCILVSGCTQEDIFTGIAEPLLLHALEGFNVSIFCYGQTGTGIRHIQFQLY